MQECLVAANLNQSDEPLAQVLGLLSTLAEAWDAVSDTPVAEPVEAAVPGPWALQQAASSKTSLGADGAIRVAVSA